MTTTLGDLITDVRYRLSETLEAEWDDQELARYINEGARDVARRTETLQARADVTVVVGTQEYALADDLIRLYRVEYRPTSGNVYPLEYRDFNSLDSIWWTQQTQTQSIPVFFTTWGFPPTLKMVVYPIPAEGGIFKVYYYRLPARLTSNANVLEIPEGWTDLVITYCEYLALRKDHDPRWQESKTLYESSLETMIEMTRRWSDQGGVIVPETGGFLPWWLAGTGGDGY